MDSLPTVCAVSALAMMLSTTLHEGVGHALTALLTVSPSGVLSTVAWNSAYDSKLVDAGGTIVNLIAAAIFWLLLRNAERLSAATRLFLLLACAFNLFAGTGYFLFSGLTDFGDWAAVIQGLRPHGLWRVALVAAGILGYWGALVVAGTSLFRSVGFRPRADRRRISRLMLVAYLNAVLIACLGGALNPMGVEYVFFRRCRRRPVQDPACSTCNTTRAKTSNLRRESNPSTAATPGSAFLPRAQRCLSLCSDAV